MPIFFKKNILQQTYQTINFKLIVISTRNLRLILNRTKRIYNNLKMNTFTTFVNK